jgi:hypothetical protein
MSETTPERHPLTESLVAELRRRTYGDPSRVESGPDWDELVTSLDDLVRERMDPKPVTAESGVRFPDMPSTKVSMAAQFIESGNQMSMAIIGTEPVLLIQPEFDADTNEVTLITTAVDLPPEGLALVLEALLDGTREIINIQAQQRAEMAQADADLRAANAAFEKGRPKA